MSRFVHLHTHSHYSLLDGLPTIDALVAYAKEINMDALAVTDHGNLYGAVEFYKKAKAAGIKPILGVEAYMDLGENTPTSRGEKYYHLVLLAKNNAGWKNLVRLVSDAHLKNFYYKPRIKKEWLRERHEGLIALSGCLGGEVQRQLQAGNYETAKRTALEYHDIFGKGNFYLEIGHHPGIKDTIKPREGVIRIARETGIPLVATQDSHYLRSDDAKYHDILLAVQTGNQLTDPDRLTLKDDDFSLRSGAAMGELFRDLPEAIENTGRIADLCTTSLELGKIQLPHYDVPSGKTPMEHLRELVKERVAARYSAVTPAIEDRINFELGVIEKMGFADYFLIVEDLVNWAKDRGIAVGPGRGSAAGSILSYILRITDIDPLKYDLLFERFLNPERIQMPDIDIDIADRRRDEVFGYLREKYGEDRVAHIITYGTMAARASVRDVGRALGVPLPFCDQLAKLIPFNADIKTALNLPEVKALAETEEDARKILDAASRLEGVARHASMHACGIVISREPLVEQIPLQRSPKDPNLIMSQFDMYSLEDLGILKIDLLGLKNLTTIEDAIRMIEARHNEKLDAGRFPLADEQTFKLLRAAETIGLFQLESAGMRRYLKELKPTELEDIIAMVSLYRPGPLEAGMVPKYIDRKHDREKISYLHPSLEPILKNTYGIGIYQEQMMRIARDLAGYTLSEADTLRKAIGKKIKKLLDEQEGKLINGMIKNGISERTAKEIWELFPSFARYGFNRCLTGDARIQNPNTGELIAVEELYKKQRRLKQTLSLNETSLKTYKNKILDIIDNGVKEIFELKTRSGRVIKATANHPFYAVNGWRNLGLLKAGDRVAVPRSLPNPSTPINMGFHKLSLLGYVLSEGNLCHPHGFYYYAKDPIEVEDYCHALLLFNNTQPTIDVRKAATAVYSRRTNLRAPSEAVDWINSIGLRYKKAAQKTFPNFVFRLSNADLALLIAKMFQGDGCINDTRAYPNIFYATSSPFIARDLQHLLLRLSVLSTIHTKKFKYRGGIKIGYTISINRHDNIKNFLRAIIPYLVGKKQIVAKRILEEHPIINGSLKSWAARGSKDIIPTAIITPLLRQAVVATKVSFVEVARSYQFSERLFDTDTRKVGFLRETVAYLGEKLKHTSLKIAAASDVYWDEIISITPKGTETTYDLTMEKDHNFIANDVFVHNSHAACYAAIAYQTAYLKTHYPVEFMTALLNSEAADVERIAFVIAEARRMGIKIQPPDINRSDAWFAPEEENIRFGLAAIKNVGSAIVDAIVEERRRGGPYESLSALLSRVQHKDLNKKTLENLTKAGALDSLGTERNAVLHTMDDLLRVSSAIKRTAHNHQAGLFAAAPLRPAIRLVAAPAATAEERLAWEKELLGLYLTDHPLNGHQKKLNGKKMTAIRDALRLHEDGATLCIAGIVAKIQRITTKKGDPMLFAKIEDLSDAMEVLVFSDTLKTTLPFWREGSVVKIRGRLSTRNGEPKLICNEVKELT